MFELIDRRLLEEYIKTDQEAAQEFYENLELDDLCEVDLAEELYWWNS